MAFTSSFPVPMYEVCAFGIFTVSSAHPVYGDDTAEKVGLADAGASASPKPLRGLRGPYSGSGTIQPHGLERWQPPKGQ